MYDSSFKISFDLQYINRIFSIQNLFASDDVVQYDDVIMAWVHSPLTFFSFFESFYYSMLPCNLLQYFQEIPFKSSTITLLTTVCYSKK